MTLMSKVKNKNIEQKSRTIIHAGSQNSYVNKKVIENLNVVPNRKIKMTYCLFGKWENSVQMHNAYDLIIFYLYDSSSFIAKVFFGEKKNWMCAKTF